jgi:cysteine-rich repeat protein
MNVARIALVAPLLAFVGCGDGGSDDGSATDDPTSETDVTSPTEPSASTMPSTSADTTEGPVEEGCGNGVLEDGEQCDEGAANSDSEPDACRTDCRVAHCADGVVDPGAGEECDDGNQNAQEPNACRETCVLPSCGDGVQDQGEPCDDGNAMWGDSCFECQNLWYFVLDSPDLAGEGDVTILRSTREGPPVPIVSGEPSYNGIRQLALGPAAATLYALQSAGDVDRVLALDPVDGALLMEYAVDTGVLGYSPDLQGFARGSDGFLWLAVQGDGATHIVSVDPVTGTVVDQATLGGDLGVVDVVADDAGALYVSTGGANTIVRVDLASFGTTTFGDGGDGLVNPIGLAFDPVQSNIWAANNPAGAPSTMVRATLDGTFTPYGTAGTEVDPYVHGVAIDIGGVVLTTQRDYDRVVAVENFDTVQVFLTDMVVAPTDIEIANFITG